MTHQYISQLQERNPKLYFVSTTLKRIVNFLIQNFIFTLYIFILIYIYIYINLCLKDYIAKYQQVSKRLLQWNTFYWYLKCKNKMIFFGAILRSSFYIWEFEEEFFHNYFNTNRMRTPHTHTHTQKRARISTSVLSNASSYPCERSSRQNVHFRYNIIKS